MLCITERPWITDSTGLLLENKSTATNLLHYRVTYFSTIAIKCSQRWIQTVFYCQRELSLIAICEGLIKCLWMYLGHQSNWLKTRPAQKQGCISECAAETVRLAKGCYVYAACDGFFHMKKPSTNTNRVQGAGYNYSIRKQITAWGQIINHPSTCTSNGWPKNPPFTGIFDVTQSFFITEITKLNANAQFPCDSTFLSHQNHTFLIV